MKLSTFTLTLLLALPFAAQAEIKETKSWQNGRNVTVRTETSPLAPSDCLMSLDRTLDQQGWHDQIFRSVQGNRAYLICSQRDADACCVKEVKITLWRAAQQEGKTVTESWIYNVRASEVNRFLDDELPQIAREFTNGSVNS